MQDGMAHAKVFGQLMEVTADTMGKIEHAQNKVLVQSVRQHLAGELFDSEIARQRATVAEERHQRLLADARRTRKSWKLRKGSWRPRRKSLTPNTVWRPSRNSSL
jgi:hypothetical protein